MDYNFLNFFIVGLAVGFVIGFVIIVVRSFFGNGLTPEERRVADNILARFEKATQAYEKASATEDAKKEKE